MHFQKKKTERHVCRVVIQEIPFQVYQMSLFLGPRVTRNLFHTDLRCSGCSSSHPVVLLGIWLFWNSFLECWSCCSVFKWVVFLCFVLRLEHFEERCAALILDRYSLLIQFFLDAAAQFPRCLDFLGYLELRLKSVTLLGWLSSFS